MKNKQKALFKYINFNKTWCLKKLVDFFCIYVLFLKKNKNFYYMCQKSSKKMQNRLKKILSIINKKLHHRFATSTLCNLLIFKQKEFIRKNIIIMIPLFLGKNIYVYIKVLQIDCSFIKLIENDNYKQNYKPQLKSIFLFILYILKLTNELIIIKKYKILSKKMLKINLALLTVLFSLFFSGMCILNATYSETITNPYVGQLKQTNQTFSISVDPAFRLAQPQVIGGIQLITGLHIHILNNKKVLKNYRFVCSYLGNLIVRCNFQADIETAWSSFKYTVFVIGTDATQDNHNLQIGFIPSQRIDPSQYVTQAYSVNWMGTLSSSANYIYIPMIASIQQINKGSQPLDIQLINPLFDPITGLATYKIQSNSQSSFRIQISYVIAALSVPSFPTYQAENIATATPKPQAIGPLRIAFRPTTTVFNQTNTNVYYSTYTMSGVQAKYDPLFSDFGNLQNFRNLQVQQQCTGFKRNYSENVFEVKFDDNTTTQLSKQQYEAIAAAYDYSQDNISGLLAQANTPKMYQSSANNQTLSLLDLENMAGYLSENTKTILLQMIKNQTFVTTVSDKVLEKCVQCGENEVFVLSVGLCRPKQTTLREIMSPLLDDKNFVTLDNPNLCLQKYKDRITELENNHWLLSVYITADELAACKA